MHTSSNRCTTPSPWSPRSGPTSRPARRNTARRRQMQVGRISLNLKTKTSPILTIKLYSTFILPNTITNLRSKNTDLHHHQQTKAPTSSTSLPASSTRPASTPPTKTGSWKSYASRCRHCNWRSRKRSKRQRSSARSIGWLTRLRIDIAASRARAAAREKIGPLRGLTSLIPSNKNNLR